MKKTMAKPVNWQDFEDLCKRIWKYEYKCQDIKRNGRSGQEQNGVDVSGFSDELDGYFGIQCKGKDDYTNANLSEKEIITEIEKAKTFKPKLKKFIFATTANKDSKIEQFIREKDTESRNAGFFSISLFSWEDLTDLIKDHKSVHDWYVKDKHYSEDINVSIRPIIESNEVDTPLLIPKYTKQKTKYILKNQMFSGMNIDFSKFPNPYPGLVELTPAFSRKEEDHSYVNLSFIITNTGTVSLIDCNISLEIVSDDNIYFAGYIEFFGLQSIFTNKDKVLFKNLASLNVGISREFKALIKFPETIEEVSALKDSIVINWSFSSNQNSDLITGSFDILVRPQIIELDDICTTVYDSKHVGENVKFKPQALKK